MTNEEKIPKEKRKTISASDAAPNGFLRFLYENALGRLLLKVMVARPISVLGGAYLRSRFSRHRIAGFIRKNQIDMSEYEEAVYPSFGDFFIRKIRPERRPIGSDRTRLISPCDAKLSIFPIDEETIFSIKGSHYTVERLLGGDAPLAASFRGGWALVFRLCVDDYHRYCYPDDGSAEKSIKIPGKLHTVQPIALARVPVFLENSREVTLLHTAHFGDMVQVEVGALMVGRIHNEERTEPYQRGEEKGRFEFGGSTIVLLVQKDRITPDLEIVENSKRDLETVVKMGEYISQHNIF